MNNLKYLWMKLTLQVAWKASFQAVFWKVVPLCLSMLVDALPKIDVSFIEPLLKSNNIFIFFSPIKTSRVKYPCRS